MMLVISSINIVHTIIQNIDKQDKLFKYIVKLDHDELFKYLQHKLGGKINENCKKITLKQKKNVYTNCNSVIAD